jgi:hypothetical protein
MGMNPWPRFAPDKVFLWVFFAVGTVAASSTYVTGEAVAPTRVISVKEITKTVDSTALASAVLHRKRLIGSTFQLLRQFV